MSIVMSAVKAKQANRAHRLYTRMLPALWISLLVSGCTTIGPDSVSRDRFDYSAAIRDSWKREMLQNIVNIRYSEPPVFLDVSSVISQYELGGTINAGAAVGAGFTAGDVYNVGGATRYTERPTITYQPLTGPKFANSMLTPLEPASLLSLTQAGFPVDFLFRIGVRSINGIRNNADGMMYQVEDPKFEVLLEALRRLQLAGLVHLQLRKKGADNPGEPVIVFRVPDREAGEFQDDLALVRTILKLDAGAESYRIVFGNFAPSADVIALQTRSILAVLLEMSADIEVPPEHVANGNTLAFARGDTTRSSALRIHSQREAPENPYAAVKYQDYWYWIDSIDTDSKSVMSFMVVLSSLIDSGRSVQLPVVTVGAGR
jgi:hypothetical protein